MDQEKKAKLRKRRSKNEKNFKKNKSKSETSSPIMILKNPNSPNNSVDELTMERKNINENDEKEKFTYFNQEKQVAELAKIELEKMGMVSDIKPKPKSYFEICKLNPEREKTSLCKYGDIYCDRSAMDCFFAHSQSELRVNFTDLRFKKMKCKNFPNCEFEEICVFLHDEIEYPLNEECKWCSVLVNHKGHLIRKLHRKQSIKYDCKCFDSFDIYYSKLQIKLSNQNESDVIPPTQISYDGDNTKQHDQQYLTHEQYYEFYLNYYYQQQQQQQINSILNFQKQMYFQYCEPPPGMCERNPYYYQYYAAPITYKDDDDNQFSDLPIYNQDYESSGISVKQYEHLLTKNSVGSCSQNQNVGFNSYSGIPECYYRFKQ